MPANAVEAKRELRAWLLENADDLDKTQTLLKLITAPVSALKDSMTLAYAAYNNLKGAAL